MVLFSNLGSFLQEIETYLVVLSKGSFGEKISWGVCWGMEELLKWMGSPTSQPWEWAETKTTQGEAEEAGRTDAFFTIEAAWPPSPP